MIYLSIFFCVLLSVLTAASLVGKVEVTRKRFTFLLFLLAISEIAYFIDNFTSFGAQ